MKARGEIRERDAEGTLIAAGFEWTKPSFGQHLLLIIVILLGALAAVAVTMAMQPNLEELPHLIIAAVFLALAVLTYQYRKHRSRPKGAIIFYADGEIAMPHGRPGNPDGRRFKVPWSEVSSIGTDAFSVVIYFRDGDIVSVAYPPADATLHKVAVQLQLALTAIREAAAQASKPRRAPAPETQIVID